MVEGFGNGVGTDGTCLEDAVDVYGAGWHSGGKDTVGSPGSFTGPAIANETVFNESQLE